MNQKNPLQERYDLAGPKVAEALKRRHFEAYYCRTGKEAAEKLLSLIPHTDTVSWGGSMTLTALNIQGLLNEQGYQVIDRDTAKTPEERNILMRNALSCGTFLMSSNAITEDGQLFNIDGGGNRIAAMIYGPKSVIVIAGMNKVVKTLADAESRTRNFAAPANHQRVSGEAPCTVTGECADCVSPGCICTYMVTTRMSKPEKRIKVILVGEVLGL
jgi:L-lactate utilization protein LutB